MAPSQRNISLLVSVGNALNPVKGIVLRNHGCDGLGAAQFYEVDGKFFNTLGFKYIAPDSFADPRPKDVCVKIGKTRRRDTTFIHKLRIAQTHRAINNLEKQHPGLPIYLWGHSEGSHIAQMLKAKIAGIISSGNSCGVNGQKIANRSKERVLYLLVDRDPFVLRGKRKITRKQARKCRKLVRTKKVRVVVLKDAGHGTLVWRKEVAEAMARFLTGKRRSFFVQTDLVDMKLNSSQQVGFKVYPAKSGKKAFAINHHGTQNYVWNGKYANDVVVQTLYECTNKTMVNPFASEKIPCRIMNLNGEAVKWFTHIFRKVCATGNDGHRR